MSRKKKALEIVQLSRVILGLLPPVDPPENAVGTIDFVRILDNFDVSTLNNDQIDVINRGNWYETG